MKLAVLADIHGNWPALEAVVDDIGRWQPDRVVVNGDVVNGGPNSDRCWRYIRERQAVDGWLVLRGNHEEYVAAWAQSGQPLEGPRYELSRFSHWTYEQLNRDVSGLADLRLRWDWKAPDGSQLVVMHASLQGNRQGIYPHTTDADARRMVDLSADIFVTSHTHIAHQRSLGRMTIINTGAVGLAGDGDRRAAYGRIVWDRAEGWQATVRRVPYEMAATERAYLESGFLSEAGPLALMTLVELRSARDAKTRWTTLYGERILRGDLTVEKAVREFLDGTEFRPFLPVEARFRQEIEFLEGH